MLTSFPVRKQFDEAQLKYEEPIIEKVLTQPSSRVGWEAPLQMPNDVEGANDNAFHLAFQPTSACRTSGDVNEGWYGFRYMFLVGTL